MSLPGVRRTVLVLGLLLAWGRVAPAQTANEKASYRAIRQHIRQGWKTLSRDLRSVSPDLKVAGGPRDRLLLYVSPKEDRGAVERRVRRQLGANAGHVEVRTLPKPGARIKEHGMLYLPEPYVVPGGRFDEMYGWDSYFIQKGLLRDRQVKMARSLANNLVYEVRHYGKVLNASRTWSLGRSHPPFLTRMILDVYEKTGDRGWAASTIDAVEDYHRFWTQGSRRTRATGLSRYFDDSPGLAPEVAPDEYARTLEHLREQTGNPAVARLLKRDGTGFNGRFLKGDRAMRESGNDTTSRFGPAGGATHEYNPVDLNSLLYKMEIDAASIADLAGRKKDAADFRRAAAERKKAINTYLWDRKRGLYFDYHVPTKTRSDAVFASTFFPLWAGVASPAQARRVVENLHLLEAPGGLLASNRTTGHQWDKPFGWAPLVDVAVTGLRNYGYHAEANRISVKFLSMVLRGFKHNGTIMEKYDVLSGSEDVSKTLRFGYTSNEIGFGWTNGVFVDLYHRLPRSDQRKVLAAGN
jgi:alpha,alpha-trehalase